PRTGFPIVSSTVVLVLATLGATAFRPLRSRPSAPTTARADSISARADAGRILGSPTAKVWFIEASDFQCPFCKQWHDESFATIMKEYVNTGKVRYAFLNDPLSMHQFSMQAAEAGMCASAQNKFWPMHQELFATQHQWEVLPDPAAYFDSLAVKAGVNAAEWRDCVRTHATRPIIDADRYRLRSSGVQSTPTFFVGSEHLEGVQPLAVMRKVLDDALAKAGAP
ncbi:MAG: DsbA family protein, partial [Gemmatimonadaceae bacterium]